MKTKRIIRFSQMAGVLAGAALLTSCATYEPVKTSAVTSAISFDDINRFATDIPDTSTVDTAFSKEVQQLTHDILVAELEGDGFDYVGESNPELRVQFSTYVTQSAGYIDTSRPVVKRVIEQEGIQASDGTFIPTDSRESIQTTREAEPIYVSGPTRIFLLDVVDSDTEVLLWRGYTTTDEIGLDADTLEAQIDRLVDRLDEET